MTSGGTPRPNRVSAAVHGLRGRGVLLASPADAERIRSELVAAGFAVAEADLSGTTQRDGSSDQQEGSSGDEPHAPAERSPDTLDAEPLRTSLRTAQAAVAVALRLPETAGRNLDAMVDSLRDLATWWPESARVVLMLHHAESLVESDLPGWHTLVEILREASHDLWRGAPGDRAFETVALVDRHGVLRLPGEDQRQSTPGREHV
ncbi:MAG TPA: barstar family protein [Ornithinicoccus sp.]|nr:barstar family protein [Ornithinicoccus sp.]